MIPERRSALQVLRNDRVGRAMQQRGLFAYAFVGVFLVGNIAEGDHARDGASVAQDGRGFDPHGEH